MCYIPSLLKLYVRSRLKCNFCPIRIVPEAQQKMFFKTSLNEEHTLYKDSFYQQLLQGAVLSVGILLMQPSAMWYSFSQTYPIRQRMKAAEDELLKCDANSSFYTVDTSKGFNRCSLFAIKSFAIKYWLKLP